MKLVLGLLAIAVNDVLLRGVDDVFMDDLMTHSRTPTKAVRQSEGDASRGGSRAVVVGSERCEACASSAILN